MKVIFPSRERLLMAIDHKEADYVPLVLRPFGWKPLLDVFLELGIDLLINVDPQGKAELPRLKRETGERICFWGGVNSAITLGRGSRDEIRDAVIFAISTLAPGEGLSYPLSMSYLRTRHGAMS